MPSRQFAPRASEITMLVLCSNLFSDKTGFCLQSPDASASALAKCFSQVPEAQSLDYTAEVWYSYTGIKKQSPAHNSIEQALAAARASKE